MAEEKDYLEMVARVMAACEGQDTQDRLFVVEMAWLALASNARNERLSVPGGFPTERARQVERLNKLAAIVAADEPDLEMERLWLEGDINGVLEHLKSRLQEEERGE